MDIAFNEISTHFVAASKEEASEWMDNFFNTCSVLSKRLYKIVYVRSVFSFKEIFIGPNYSFSEWLHTIEDREFMRMVIGTIANKPFLQEYPYYYYNKIQCHGLGKAFEGVIYSISYPCVYWPTIIDIEKEYFNDNEDVIVDKCEVENISCEDDVYHFHQEIVFQHHKKHDNKRHNLNDGESTLHYSIPDEHSKVQKLLDCSFGEGKLYNWDPDKDLYIEFQAHEEKKYHGYHIIDSNRVPDKIKKKIDGFRKI